MYTCERQTRWGGGGALCTHSHSDTKGGRRHAAHCVTRSAHLETRAAPREPSPIKAAALGSMAHCSWAN